jgi:glycosyltransferase involved in cell wall biosynthesis
VPDPVRPCVVIAAHTEEAVLGRTLARLVGHEAGSDLEVVVAANGCTDATAQVARGVPGVQVVEIPTPGKANALNLAERRAKGYPRVYLDADIALSRADLERLCSALDDGSVLAACPSRRFDLTGCSLVVRAYCAVSQHLPAFERGLFGKGVVALSLQGRQRFTTFPPVIADDLFLDSLFGPGEKAVLQEVTVSVAAPRRARDLLRRLERVRRGNRQLRAAAPAATGGASTARSLPLSWLADVVLPRPWLAPAAVVYVAVTVVAELRARRATGVGWGQDRSTRFERPGQPRAEQPERGQ